MDIKDIKVGQRWLLKSAEECRACFSDGFVSEMEVFCEKEVTIRENSDGYLRLEENQYFWSADCFDRMVSDVPNTTPEDSPINPTPENTGTVRDFPSSPYTDKLFITRPISSVYDVCHGEASVRLVVDHVQKRYRIESKAKDCKFLFDTAQQGDPEKWGDVLDAIYGAMLMGNHEVKKNGVGDAGE